MDRNREKLEDFLSALEDRVKDNKKNENSTDEIEATDAHARAFAYGLAAQCVKKILDEWEGETQ